MASQKPISLKKFNEITSSSKAVPLSEFNKKIKSRGTSSSSNLIDEDIEESMRSQWMKKPLEESAKALKSGLRGYGQGSLLGFGDELEAGARTAADFITGDLKGKELLDRYYKTKEKINNEIAKDSESYLSPYYAGEVASLFGPGALGKLAKYGYKGAMALGGLAGLGSSDAKILKGEDLGEAALDTALGAGTGAASQKLSNTLGRAIMGKTADEAAEPRKFAKIAGKLIGDVDERTIEQYLDNPQRFKESIKRGSADIRQEIFDTAPKALEKYLKEASGEGYKILKDGMNEMRPKDIAKGYNKIIRSILRKTKGKIREDSIEGQAIAYLQGQRQKWYNQKLLDKGGRNIPIIPNHGPRVEPTSIKDRIIRLDREDVFNQGRTDMPDLLKRARAAERDALDAILKKNPEYKKHMAEVTQPLGDLKGWVSRNINTPNKLETFLKRQVRQPEKLTTAQKDYFKKLEKTAGTDLFKDYQNSLLYEALEGVSTKSSRDVNKFMPIGAIIGSMLGMPAGGPEAMMFGAAIGGVVGDFMSKYGKKETFKAIEAADKLARKMANLSPIARDKMLNDAKNTAIRQGGSALLTMEILKEFQENRKGY